MSNDPARREGGNPAISEVTELGCGVVVLKIEYAGATMQEAQTQLLRNSDSARPEEGGPAISEVAGS